MKQLFIFLFFMMCLTGFSQSKSHYDLDLKVPKTEIQQIGTAVKTNSTAKYKDKTYPVYLTKKGKLFIVYPNKEGTGYNKKYIKEEIY